MSRTEAISVRDGPWSRGNTPIPPLYRKTIGEAGDSNEKSLQTYRKNVKSTHLTKNFMDY